MLAFNKKAAEELREKMEGLFSTFADREISMPHVMTFHALAYTLKNDLLGFLKDEGVSYRKLSEEEIWERIKERAIASFFPPKNYSITGRQRRATLSL